jgi:hypothetical protein
MKLNWYLQTQDILRIQLESIITKEKKYLLDIGRLHANIVIYNEKKELFMKWKTI